jgi:hypothetical protein
MELAKDHTTSSVVYDVRDTILPNYWVRRVVFGFVFRWT